MNITSQRRDYCEKEGREAELKFKSVVENRGNIVRGSSRSENIYDHIDFWVNDVSVDVKGLKNYESIWLELKNVHGNKGWLDSKVDYISFDILELSSFCIFKRYDLLNFVLTNVHEYTSSSDEYMKFYTRERWGRKDVIVKVSFEHIKHLLIQKLYYANS